ncbi:MAG: DUF4433 domain-containing protein [Anaerohalosphaeraceae bacterium]
MKVKELYYIMPIDNISSVIEHGILSNQEIRRRKIPCQSIADENVQNRRKNKSVPGGKPLHYYANLYFDAHNPMLSRVRNRNKELCVLRIDTAVMHLPGVVITDMNAASKYARFYPYPGGLKCLDFEMIYARCWLHHDDIFLGWRHKSVKCAEVLVPVCVERKYIIGAYVYDEEARLKLKSTGFDGIIKIKRELFF